MCAKEKNLDHLSPGGECVRYKNDAVFLHLRGNSREGYRLVLDLGGKSYMHAYLARVVSGYYFYI